MRKLKLSLDPDNLLNPGKVIDIIDLDAARAAGDSASSDAASVPASSAPAAAAPAADSKAKPKQQKASKKAAERAADAQRTSGGDAAKPRAAAKGKGSAALEH
jgi:hypothetical protein